MKTLNTSRGVTLVELMISLAIGMIVVLAAGSVYLGNKQTYRTAEAVSRLQDEARFAIIRLQTAIQQAGYFGRLDSATLINGRRNSGSDITSLPSTDCAPGWSIDLDLPVDSPDTSSGNPFATTCLHENDIRHELVSGSDILVVRRADADADAAASGNDKDPVAADNAGRIYLRADVRHGELYVADGTVPAGYDADTVEDRLLITEMFYLTSSEFEDESGNGDNVPTLRRQYLTKHSGTPSLRTERIARYVEDFQLQFGEDTNGDGNADRFVDPPALTPQQAVAVRVWLLFRSGTRESDYTAPASFTLADNTYTVPSGTENFRRLLVTHTYALRN